MKKHYFEGVLTVVILILGFTWHVTYYHNKKEYDQKLETCRKALDGCKEDKTTLQHQYDQVILDTQAILKDNEAIIQGLEEKVKYLEKRLAAEMADGNPVPQFGKW